MKAILAHHELAGPAPELPAILESRIQDAANKTLGHLIGRFLENVVSQEAGERDLLGDDVPTDVISFGFRLSIQLSAEDLAKTSDGLKELVVLRNTLVHHFIERFDLWQADGCAAASIYLQDCYARIDGHYEELRAWAAHMETSRQYAASVMQSPEFQNLLFNGVAPDGTVDWNTARCIWLLRDAELRHAVEGWAPLAVVVSWLAQHHADQTPARYGCRRWVQVLNESGQFDLRYLMEGGRRVPWFRSRTGQT
ncbi:hypothetical protein C8245_23455 [Paracidovorax avenae]|nr:hypothetical protein C8245_23455 [Paracidovorax avenae]